MDIVSTWAAGHALWLSLAVSVAAGGLAGWLGGCCERRGGLVDGWLYWAVAAGAVVSFALFAVGVSAQGDLVQYDHQLARALASAMTPSSLRGLAWFTHLGDRYLLTVVAVLLTAWLWWGRRERALALLCAVAAGGGGLLNRGLKHTFERVRPEHLHGYVSETGWSFPSGHASASVAVYGIGCYIALRLLPARWHRLCLTVATMLIVAIGLSRVLLQVHYLSDVLAGFAASLAWLALCLGLWRRWYRPGADDVGHRVG